MKFILGKKLNMTQVFREDGTVVPVTKIQAGPCVVTQVKSNEKDGTNSVQIGFGVQKKFRLTQAEQGHLKDIKVEGKSGLTVRELREIKMDASHDLKKGDKYDVNIFEVGEKIEVIGNAKGRGFQGVVKRHGFHGSPASHGHKDQLRMPGSIGATDAARVFKGTRMGGHMGTNQVTVKNLEIIEVNPEENEIVVKGAVPGARNGLVLIFSGEGKIEIKQEEASVKEEKVEEVKTEEAPVKAEVKEEKVEEKVEKVEEVKEDKKETK